MLKVAIIGPESTGKTELAQKLAQHFNCNWEPELAREYVEKLDREYYFEDVTAIARMQVEQELKYEQPDTDVKCVFFDTDLIITKVWLDYKYKVVPRFVTDRLSTRFFDLYLLCKPDLPWEYDPVREHGDDRDFFYNWYKKEIKQLGTPYVEIQGIGAERLQNAIKALDACPAPQPPKGGVF